MSFLLQKKSFDIGTLIKRAKRVQSGFGKERVILFLKVIAILVSVSGINTLSFYEIYI